MNVFTVCLAQELAEHNVTVNALLPSWTATEAVLYLDPHAKPSTMQPSRMWGRYAVLLNQTKLTGQLFTEEKLRQVFGQVSM